MAILAEWRGDGLSPGNLTTSSAGPGDNPFQIITGTVPTIESTGDHGPRIRFDQAAGSASYIGYNNTVYGAGGRTQTTARLYVEITALASGSWQFFTGLTSNNTSQIWRVTLAGSGAGASANQIRITNTGGTTLAHSGTNVVPLNTPVRMEVIHDNGTVTATAFNVSTGSQIATASFGGFNATMDSIRFGPNTSSPTVPRFWFDNFAISDTAAYIGPFDSTPPPSAAWSLWNGTTEVPLTLDGVWNGTTIDALSFDSVN